MSACNQLFLPSPVIDLEHSIAAVDQELHLRSWHQVSCWQHMHGREQCSHTEPPLRTSDLLP